MPRSTSSAANLWTAMGRLEQMIILPRHDGHAKLEDKANDLDTTDPAKAKAIRETALFYVRQRTQDLLTQMAVTVQGYLALDLVKKNNVELVKGVDRASTTTVVGAAHRGDGRAGADQPEAGARTDHRAQHHHRQHHRFDRQAAEEPDRDDPRAGGASTIPIETLQRAFQNIYDTMDAIDTFKLKALDSMKTTVTAGRRGREVEGLYRPGRGRGAEFG
jgi:hypothetical protein